MKQFDLLTKLFQNWQKDIEIVEDVYYIKSSKSTEYTKWMQVQVKNHNINT